MQNVEAGQRRHGNIAPSCCCFARQKQHGSQHTPTLRFCSLHCVACLSQPAAHCQDYWPHLISHATSNGHGLHAHTAITHSPLCLTHLRCTWSTAAPAPAATEDHHTAWHTQLTSTTDQTISAGCACLHADQPCAVHDDVLQPCKPTGAWQPSCSECSDPRRQAAADALSPVSETLLRMRCVCVPHRCQATQATHPARCLPAGG